MIIFASGTCRLLKTIYDGRGKINPLHGFTNIDNKFDGPNFLGKQKSSKDHIQFIKFIKEEIDIPEDIKKDFFSAFSDKYPTHQKPSNPDKNLENIKKDFDEVDYYIFEISSLKYRTRNGYSVSDENTTNFEKKVLSEEELEKDLIEIINLLGEKKKIIFYNHYRLQKMRKGPAIKNREIIYRTINKISNQYLNVFQYDPSYINGKGIFFDPWHYTPKGYKLNFNSLLEFIRSGKKFNDQNIDESYLVDSEDESPDFHRKNFKRK
jgi:hypothetical protein